MAEWKMSSEGFQPPHWPLGFSRKYGPANIREFHDTELTFSLSFMTEARRCS